MTKDDLLDKQKNRTGTP